MEKSHNTEFLLFLTDELTWAPLGVAAALLSVRQTTCRKMPSLSPPPVPCASVTPVSAKRDSGNTGPTGATTVSESPMKRGHIGPVLTSDCLLTLEASQKKDKQRLCGAFSWHQGKPNEENGCSFYMHIVGNKMCRDC